MTQVRHQKWWGWGDEGVRYSYEGKPKLPHFVYKHLGLDIESESEPDPVFDDLVVPPTMLDEGHELRRRLQAIVGAGNVWTDDMTRVVHTYGKGLRDLVRIRRGDLGRVPDAVVYPGSSEEVQTTVDALVAANAVIIPYGGGSNIVGALEAIPDETRPVISLDLGRMNKLLDLDPQSGLARIQAGALGPEMEKQLNDHGWTVGHFPDSFVWSSLGGWIATRSSGIQSDKYGDIADIVRGMQVVLPGRTVDLRPLPSTSSGPSVREMILGSEGRLGVITEAWVHVHRLPQHREIQAYFFPTYEAGLDATYAVYHSEAQPVLMRVSDAAETEFSLANGHKSSAIGSLASKAMQQVMRHRGWDLSKIALSFIGFEGTSDQVRHQRSMVNRIVKGFGAIGVGQGPGALYDEKKFDTPYIRDFLLGRGVVGDVSETSTPWSMAKQLHTETVRRAHQAIEETGKRGYVMCHLSHSYHSGACQYFTFCLADDSDQMLANYDHVKRAIQQSFVEHGGTVSHHHGVGEEHSPWMEQDISEGGVFIQRMLFDGVDPGRNLNPGKIIHEGAAGITSNSADYAESMSR